MVYEVLLFALDLRGPSGVLRVPNCGTLVIGFDDDEYVLCDAVHTILM